MASNEAVEKVDAVTAAEEVQDDGDPSPSIRFKITSILAGIGGLCGAAVGAALTYLGNVISGYPIPPDLGIYLWNSGIMAGLGATLGPPMVWTMLRRVPLWRALVEPAAAGLAGSIFSMLFAPALFAGVVPLAILGAAFRLRFEYRDRGGQLLEAGGEAPASTSPSPPVLQAEDAP